MNNMQTITSSDFYKIPPERVLRSLTRNEIISICVYFDIDFDVYSRAGDKLCCGNKYVLIKKLLSENKEKIVYDVVCKRKVLLSPRSRVIYGQFSRNNIYCRRVMKKLGVCMNEIAFAIAHESWSFGPPLTYEELAIKIRARINQKLERAVALQLFEDFVQSL